MESSNHHVNPSKTAIPSFGRVNDVASFDEYFRTKLLDSTPETVGTFRTAYDCPRYTGRSNRFRQTTMCYITSANATLGCTAPQTKLCKSACQSYLDSLSATFSNAALCNKTPSSVFATTRNEAIGNLTLFCNSLPTASCSSGLKDDLALCGFSYREEAVSFCATSKEGCCIGLTSTQPKSTGPNIIFIAVSVGVAVIILLALGIFCYRRKNRTRSIFNSFAPKKPANIPLTYSSENGMYDGSGPERKNTSAPTAFGYKSRFNDVESPNPFLNAPKNEIRALNPDTMSRPFVNLDRDTIAVANSNPTSRRVYALEDFEPNMNDEMRVKYGDEIILQNEYDDGWAFGVNVHSRLDGMFPMAIVSSKPLGSNTKRTNSVYSARSKSLLQHKNNVDNRLRVMESYKPNLDDELAAQVGDFIVVHEQYNDGEGV